jgi:hypothetical protein
MKLIHLPTGEETEHPNYAAELLMAQYPAEYIRAELSQYWRVEGYDKSFDWFEMMVGRQPNDSRYQWITNKCSKSIKADAFFSSHGQLTQLPQISRAEFEHHIYNRWKKVQDGMSQLEKGIANSRLNEQLDMSDVDKLREAAEKEHKFTSLLTKDLIGNPATPYIKTNSTNTADCDLSKPLINEQDLLSANTPIRYDLETLKQQAEKMGYELVRKPKEPVEWRSNENRYSLKENELYISSFKRGTSVILDTPEIETLIEKYNQFKSNP